MERVTLWGSTQETLEAWSWITCLAQIQALIPIGLDSVHELLQAEATMLVCEHYNK